MASKVRQLASNVTRKQDTFYFESSKFLPEFKHSNEYSDIYNKTPVVALLGWAGSKPENLQKYAQIYTDMGYHTIQFSPSNKLTFFTGIETHKALTSQFLDLFREQRLTNNPIFLHMFSNAGAMVIFQNVLSDTKEKSKLFMKNCVGIVYDSAPGEPGDLINFAQAIMELMGIKQAVMKYSFAAMLVAYFKIYFFFTDFFKNFIEIQLKANTPPLLFLYSKADKLIGSDKISEFVQEKKRLFPNTPIKSVVYEDAGHIMIYKKYPIDYLKHIKEHLQLCNCDLQCVLDRKPSKNNNKIESNRLNIDSKL